MVNSRSLWHPSNYTPAIWLEVFQFTLIQFLGLAVVIDLLSKLWLRIFQMRVICLPIGESGAGTKWSSGFPLQYTQ